MTWLVLITLLFVVIGFAILKGVALLLKRFKPLVYEGSLWHMFADFPKSVLIMFIVLISFGLYQVKYQIHEMYTCSMRSNVQKVETQYSWYFDSCQFKNKQGVWIDFKQVRGTPDGEDHDGSEY